MSKFYIAAKVQNMGKKEILSMVSPDTLKRLKETDKKPEIRVYAIGHEGDADGQVIGIGRKVLKYFKDAIIQLTNKIKIGLQIFQDHAVDNLHAGREKIAEVVGKSLQTIGGKLYSLAAIYIYPQYRTLPLDIASIEANITYQEGKNKAEVLSVDQVTGIALGNSKVSKPGFPGATLLGAIQAFTKKEDKTMDLTEIKDAIREGKFSITDIYSETEIIESEPARKAKQTEYEHAKRIEKQLGKEREDKIELTKQLDEAKTESQKLHKIANKARVDTLFADVAKTRELNDKQKAFIEKNLGKFESGEDEDKVKGVFDRFIDDQLKEYDEVAKLMGIKTENEEEKGKNKGTGPGDDQDKSVSNEEEAENPEKNDFIPGGGKKK